MSSVDRTETNKAAAQLEQDPALAHAASIIAEVREAPNQELRGRTPNESWDRINNFLNEDRVYQRLVDRYVANLESRQEVVEAIDYAVGKLLSIFERQASRNPEVNAIERLGKTLPLAYRIIAAEVLKLSDKVLLNPNRIGVPLAQETENSPLDTPLVEGQGATRVAVPPTEADRVSSPVVVHSGHATEQLQRDETVFEMNLAYCSGKMGSVTDQAEFAAELDHLKEGDVSIAVRELLDETLPRDGKLHRELRAIYDLVQDCRSFEARAEESVFGCEALYRRIVEIPKSWGLGTVRDPLGDLVVEEILSAASAARLTEAVDAVNTAPPVALDCARAAASRHTFSATDLRSLSMAVGRFLLAGLEPEHVRSRVEHALQSGPSKIPHLENCAVLASRAVPVNDLFNLAPESEALIARAAQGEFDTVTVTNSRYPASIRKAIDAQLRVIREASPELREAIEEVENALPKTPAVDFSSLKVALLECGKRFTAEDDSGSRLLTLGQDFIAMAQSGIQLSKVVEMAANLPGQIEFPNVEKFFHDLASLQRRHISGVANLFSHCHTVWRAQLAGDPTQDMTGFFIEADTALQLERNGYRLISVSSKARPGGDGMEYDLIAQAPTGEIQAIEIKRALATIIGKNEAAWNIDTLPNTQLYRFTSSAIGDGLEPVMAVAFVGKGAWASGAVGQMLDAVKANLGVRPKVINAATGGKIAL